MMRLIQGIVLLLICGTAMAQTAMVPDANFLAFLKKNYSQTIDAGNQLIISKAAAVTGTFDCSGKDIASLEGIEYFTGINSLDASGNKLTTVSQISSLNLLKTLHLEDNLLTALPSLNNLTALQRLIVHTNQLTALPSLSANKQLTQIVVFNNSLTSLPDLSGLTNLVKIDAGNNKLSVPPDLSTNLQLTAVSLDRNNLTEAPDVSQLDQLNLFDVHSNRLSFADLLPYLGHPAFSSFVLSPQRNFPEPGRDYSLNDTLLLSTGLDGNIANVTYNWYFRGQQTGTASKDSFLIFPTSLDNEGYYYCIFTHPSFPGLQLQTDSFFVKAIICPTPADIGFEYSAIGCLREGRLKINLTSLPAQTYLFTLRSPVTGNTLSSTSGLFTNLTEPEYILRLKAGKNCDLTLPDPVKIPYEECVETFITPDGDGDKDNYYFSQTGKARIFDKNGKLMQTISIPGSWNGISSSGETVPQGYYVADINNGETFVRITVLY